MLIGVLCQVISEVEAQEKQDSAIRLLKETLLKMLLQLDEDESGEISYEELTHVFQNPMAMEVFANLQIDPTRFLELMEMFYTKPDSQLTISFIMEQILACRGDRQATVLDMVCWHAHTRWSLRRSMKLPEEPQIRF